MKEEKKILASKTEVNKAWGLGNKNRKRSRKTSNIWFKLCPW